MQTRSSASSGGGSSLSTTVDTERRGALATNKGRPKSNHRKFSSSNNRTPPSPPIQHHRQEEEEEEEPIEKFLEALEKNSVAVLVKEAVSKYGDPDYIERIRNVADEDPALRKIRVEVIGHEYFDAKTLTSTFESYGEIEQFSFVPNPHACFSTVVTATADILYKHRYGARTVLRMPRVKIGGVVAITKLHSLLGELRSPLTSSPDFCFRINQPLLVVEEPGEKLVNFFGKSYLVGLVMEAISKHPDFVQNVQTQASLDPTCRRIRVSCENLPRSLTPITSFYRKYGEIEECTADSSSATILYKHRKSVCKALKRPALNIAIGLWATCHPGWEIVARQLWKSTGVGWSPIPSQPDPVGPSVASCLGPDKLKDQASAPGLLLPKWFAQCEKKKPTRARNGAAPSPELINPEDDVPNDTVVEMERPIGTKKEKKRRINNQASAPIVEVLNAKQEERKSASQRKLEMLDKSYCIQAEKTRIEAEKTRLEQLKEEERIMTMNTTDMTPMLQEYYHQRQTEILESRRNKNSGGI